MMHIELGQAPSYFWGILAVGCLILFAAVGASRLIRAVAALIEARGRVKAALAALQANVAKSTPSKRTALK